MVESLIETGYIKEQRKKYKFDLTPQEVGWPSWIYDFSQDPPELWHLQDFTADLKYYDEGVINFAQWFRVLGILMCLSCFFTSFISFPLERFFFPFTNWTLIITTVSLILSYLASTDKHNFGPKAFHIKDKQQKINMIKVQARHHLFYSLSIICNFVVVTVYWSVLHQKALEKHKDVPEVGWIRVIHLHTVHILPGVSALMNTLATQAVLNRPFYRSCLYLGIFYGFIQYASIVHFGVKEIYPMINFRDGMKTWIWLGGLTITPTFVYLILCILDEKLKSRLMEKYKKLRVYRKKD